MKRPILLLTITVLAAALAAPCAQASFGLEDFDVTFTDQDGSPATQAGSHPFQMKTDVYFNKLGPNQPDGELKNGVFAQIEGLVADPTATPRCETVDFLTIIAGVRNSLCPDSSALGYVATQLVNGEPFSPIFNLAPPPGVLLKLGFIAFNTPVTIEIVLDDTPPYNGVARVTNIPQTSGVLFSILTLWGAPGDPAHDPYRGNCVSTLQPAGTVATIPGSFPDKPPSYGDCPTNAPDVPFLTLPRSCRGPLTTAYDVTSWQGGSESGAVLTHDDALPPLPTGMTGCTKLGFSPSIKAQPSSRAAESASGLDFSLEVHDEGLSSPTGLANSDIHKAVVTLPEGMTVNPSSAEGLEVCSQADLGRESVQSAPGEGCPDASRLGTVEVDTPLLDQTLKGGLFIAAPYRNPFGTLLALYVVIKSPGLGILVKQAGKVEPDPRSGRLVSTFADIPELPFSSFRLHFREGARSPLVTPPACGDYETEALLTPWAGGPPVSASASFAVISGVGASPCPPGGTPPFDPGFQAGTDNNAAAAFSPFSMRLTRRDGDQDLTRFSAELPPGMLARLAGTERCPEAAIAAARGRSGEGEGALELADPSCPASSQIGRVIAGAGVGAVLTYVPGRIYLAGPYNGAPLSVVAIVPAVAGPFDVGTVLTRQALRIDPRSAEVSVDGQSSDPIPHILAGIPLKVRDIRAYVDKPDFTLNPTSCEPSAVGATLWGGGTDVFGSADDSPLGRSARFQAADCASLAFKPRLSLALKGGTGRGAHPALTGTYAPRAGDANLRRLVLRLPRSAFLDQAHIRTICTRVQFAAKACPPGATYGRASAYSPLLEEPLSGPVILRSSNHKLPDFVADLHGIIDVEAVARIDSEKGGIRATFSEVPDAPLSKVVVRMRGAKKGLIVNSRNLCYKPGRNRANAKYSAHSARRAKGRPAVRALKCKRAGRRSHHRHAKRGAKR